MVHEYLAAISDAELRMALLDVLRRSGGDMLARPIDRSALVLELVVSLGQSIGMDSAQAGEVAGRLDQAYKRFSNTADGNRYSSASGEHADVLRVESAIWDLVRRGIVYPRFGEVLHGNDIPWAVKWLVITPLGRRLIETGDSHPAHAGFVNRITQGCPGLPQEVTARLEDAHDCFNQGLYRASVVMIRLAYEHIIRVIYDDHDLESHVSSSLKPGKRPTASTLLDGLVEVLKKVPDPPEGISNMATHIADVVRQDGNAAAHDWARDFADAAEVEELLILAGRNVRRLWSMKDRLP